MHAFFGNLVAAPEVFASDPDKFRVKIRIATSDRYRDAQGVWKDTDPCFWECWAWRGRAQNIAAQNLAKGTPVVILGSFQRQEWMDEGERRSRQTISIEHFGVDVCKLKAPRPGDGAGTSGPGAPVPPPPPAGTPGPYQVPYQNSGQGGMAPTGQTPLDTFAGPDMTNVWPGE